MPKIIFDGNPKQSFKEFLLEAADKDKVFREWCLLFEHEVYRLIPGSRNSVRADRGNTNTMTLPHSHVYAMPKGRGKEIYAVNIDGSGHDGSSGTRIPALHADYFRSQGYLIPDTNVLEGLDLNAVEADAFILNVLQE